MKSDSTQHDKRSDENEAVAYEILNKVYRQAKAQFGDAVKAFWFYDGDLCPGCEVHPIGVMKFKGQDALALNAFIYHERSVLIGYLLCESCANFIFAEAQKHPYQQTSKHADIERNLATAYHKHLASLDA